MSSSVSGHQYRQLFPSVQSGGSAKGRLPKLLSTDDKASDSNADTSGLDVGVCSVQGRRPYQEDQYAVCRFLRDPASSPASAPETHFFGVFDGHAGGKCSKAICTTIPFQFSRDESFATNVPTALNKAIQRTNEQFLEVAGRLRLNDGSTAVCVILRGLTMTISNVGDSRACLITARKGITLTEDHKPSSPTEHRRIASFGGMVTYNTGIARVAGVLAVSRAFGNYGIRSLIRADPDITQRELKSDDDFLILASDGLWDVFRANEVADICYTLQKHGVRRIADQLVQLALTRGSMDNITAVVVSLSKYVARMKSGDQGCITGSKRGVTTSGVLTGSSRLVSAEVGTNSRPSSGYAKMHNKGNFVGSDEYDNEDRIDDSITVDESELNGLTRSKVQRASTAAGSYTRGGARKPPLYVSGERKGGVDANVSIVDGCGGSDYSASTIKPVSAHRSVIRTSGSTTEKRCQSSGASRMSRRGPVSDKDHNCVAMSASSSHMLHSSRTSQHSFGHSSSLDQDRIMPMAVGHRRPASRNGSAHSVHSNSGNKRPGSAMGNINPTHGEGCGVRLRFSKSYTGPMLAFSGNSSGIPEITKHERMHSPISTNAGSLGVAPDRCRDGTGSAKSNSNQPSSGGAKLSILKSFSHG
mmetsp:Transcript_21604/g.31432  ORF Transcript_21604/g.31432 Transcript_21604/m.31432 type:complete len:643 (+) Transcript_21604:237-2165(+)|eukprot:CAMPEP_0185028566 /NCGR_PEP_ID=MMETSP1103-20130426/14347_1 /TAXON_ID=36769 /ORGANISM="Paraphysomonas bandaiensis, Strain Caron Lab Isolate" /LENGTH=642 /DNA_ID=CAMNT_0027563017 /DNA_START=231 /DNA_END=2159 /DNA_ORIENTATION=-